MALFSTTPKKNEGTPKGGKTVMNDGRLSGVVTAPWFSEKALIGTEKGVYVFQIPERATKPEIAAAIGLIYNVTPKKINIVNLPAKTKALRTRRGVGTKARRHKAYVYLKAGDTLNII